MSASVVNALLQKLLVHLVPIMVVLQLHLSLMTVLITLETSALYVVATVKPSLIGISSKFDTGWWTVQLNLLTSLKNLDYSYSVVISVPSLSFVWWEKLLILRMLIGVCEKYKTSLLRNMCVQHCCHSPDSLDSSNSRRCVPFFSYSINMCVVYLPNLTDIYTFCISNVCVGVIVADNCSWAWIKHIYARAAHLPQFWSALRIVVRVDAIIDVVSVFTGTWRKLFLVYQCCVLRQIFLTLLRHKWRPFFPLRD